MQHEVFRTAVKHDPFRSEPMVPSSLLLSLYSLSNVPRRAARLQTGCRVLLPAVSGKI